MKKMCSLVLVLLLLTSVLVPAGAADAGAANYPGTSVPMLENVTAFATSNKSDTEYKESATVYKFYYIWKDSFTKIIADYESYLTGQGFTKSDAGSVKGKYTVSASKEMINGNNLLLITVSEGMPDTDLLFNKVNYTKGSSIRVYYNNEELHFNVAPSNINGTVLVPFRAMFEALGMTVEWDAANRVATGKNDKLEISIPIGSDTAKVGGEDKKLTVPAQIIGSSTMVPLRFVSEAVGCNVVWVDNAKNILISDKNIIEWRYGGHDAKAPYQNFSYKYVNGVKTEVLRYLGTYWTDPNVANEAKETEASYKASCVSVIYDDLLRSPYDYQGKNLFFRGQVIDVFDIGSAFTSTVLVVQVTKLNFGYDDSIYVVLPKTTAYLDGDIVEIYGKCEGTKTYSGSDVPLVTATYINIAQMKVDTSKFYYYGSTTIPMLENVTSLKFDHQSGNKYYYCYYDMPYGFRSDYMSLLDKYGFKMLADNDLDDAVIYKKGTQQVLMQTQEISGVRYFIVTVSK